MDSSTLKCGSVAFWAIDFISYMKFLMLYLKQSLLFKTETFYFRQPPELLLEYTVLLQKPNVLENETTKRDLTGISVFPSTNKQKTKGRRGSPYCSLDFFIYHNAQKLAIPSRPVPFSSVKPHFQDD